MLIPRPLLCVVPRTALEADRRLHRQYQSVALACFLTQNPVWEFERQDFLRMQRVVAALGSADGVILTAVNP